MLQLTLSGLFGTESFGHPLRIGGFFVTTLEQGAGFTLSFQKVSRLMASYNPIDAA